MQIVVPHDEEELVRLRTELELLRQCGFGADDAFADALRAKTRACEDLYELGAILRDACHPEVAASIERIDAEFPHVRQLVAQDVVAGEAAQIRRDLAEQVRSSDVANAAALADGYEATAIEPAQPAAEETSPERGTAMSETDLSEQAIEEVLQNVEGNVEALQELVEGSEPEPNRDAETSPESQDAAPAADDAPTGQPPSKAAAQGEPEVTAEVSEATTEATEVVVDDAESGETAADASADPAPMVEEPMDEGQPADTQA